MTYHYALNVAISTGKKTLDGTKFLYRHFFRVDLDPGYSIEHVRQVHELLLIKFPEPDFTISVHRSQPHVSEKITAI